MKHLLLLAMLCIAGIQLQAQTCTVTKCIGASAQAQITNGQPSWSYAWTSALPGFTGQGTSTISWANVGNTPGVYALDVTITDAVTGCDTIVYCSLTIIDNPVVTYTPDITCYSNNGSVNLTGGSPAGGTYYIGGVAVTTFNNTNIGQVVTYELTSGGCTGTTTGIIGGVTAPGAVITIN